MKKYSIILIICIIINFVFAVGYRTLAYQPTIETVIQTPDAFDDITLKIYEPNAFALKTNLYQYNGKSIEVDYDNQDFDPLSTVFTEQTQYKKYYRPFTKLCPPYSSYSSYSSKDYFAFIHEEYNEYNQDSAPRSFLIIYDLKQGNSPKKIRLDSVIQNQPTDSFSTNKVFRYKNFLYIPFEIYKGSEFSTPEREFGLFRYDLTKNELQNMKIAFEIKKIEDRNLQSDVYSCTQIDDTLIFYDLKKMYFYHLPTERWSQKDITTENQDATKILYSSFMPTQRKESVLIKLKGTRGNIKDKTKFSITSIDSNFNFSKEKMFDLSNIAEYGIRNCIYSNNKLYITLNCHSLSTAYTQTAQSYIGFLIYDLQSSKVLYEGYTKNHGYNLTPRFVPNNK